MQPTAEYPVPSILRIKSLDAHDGGKRERGITLRAAVSALFVEISVNAMGKSRCHAVVEKRCLPHSTFPALGNC